MPGPVVFPCGGPNQPACPPQNTSPIKVNVGDVLETPDGQKFVIDNDEGGDDDGDEQ